MIRPVAADGRIETGGAFTPILRHRVVERIASAALQRIVLIVAPAGYGKSVALRQYLDTLSDACVRYDVREEHATLLGFVRGFADALLEVAPDVRKTLSGAYEKSRSSQTPGVDLAMWVHAHIKAFTGLIAIDDLHIAENDPEISKFLVSLIDRTKGRARWIIATRSSLDLPVGSWLAYGDMDLNIDEQDLSFTIEEARQTAKVSRVAIRDDELNDILAMTEGWPTALSFALRSSTRSIDLRNIAASTREMVYRYLAEQVYRSLDEGERELLHFIGYLPEIDLEVLRRAGYSKAKAIIESLRDRVAFIYPDRPNVYRCHDLFRQFLQYQVELEGDAAAERLRHRVAQALEESGYSAAALGLYAAAYASDDIRRILHSVGFQLLAHGHADAVHGAIEHLSQEARATDGAILALRALSEADAGRFDRAESLFERSLARSEDSDLSARVALELAILQLNQGKNTAIELLNARLASDIADATRGEICALLSIAHAYADHVEEADKAIRDAESLAANVEDEEVRAKIFLRIGIAAKHLNLPLQGVYSLLNRANTLAAENAMFSISSRALGALANLALLYEDDSTKSVWYAQQSANAAVKAGDRLSLQTALLQIISIEIKRGNMERVVSLQEQFSGTATTDAARMAYIVPSRAAVAAAAGRFDEAHRLLSMMPDRSFYQFDRFFNAALHALYLIGDDRRSAALEIVASSLSEMDNAEPSVYLYGRRLTDLSRLVMAAVEALAGRVTSATRLLQRRSSESAPALDACRDAAVALCRAMKTPNLAGDVVEGLDQLRAVGYGGVARLLKVAMERCLERNTTDAQQALTKAEVAILSALAEGRSPKDIALESGRSVNTVQVHIQNAIRKLGCSGRNEALSVARKQGLLG